MLPERRRRQEVARTGRPNQCGGPARCDDQGRDVMTRVLYGARISLSVALISVSIGASVGVSVGLTAGYAGGVVDLVLMRAIDALLAFPALLLAISITAALGPQIQNEHVTAARAIGVSPTRIAIVQILPKLANALIVQPSAASWGQDISYNQRYITNLMWWASVGPGGRRPSIFSVTR